MGENAMGGLTASDAIALSRDNNDFMGSGMGAFWIFALFLLNNGGFGFGGGNRGFVTEGELAASQQAQTNSMMLSNLQQQVAGSQYATSQAINDQTNALMQQNNTNLINAIQGFNNLGLQITNQTNQLSAQMAAMSSQLNECCCSIKTQTILNTLGRFVAWTGSGTQGAATASA